MAEKLTRALDVETKIISADEGLVDYVASNETLDCYNEVVAASGWRFTRFARNAPFVDSHDYWSIDKLLGRVENFQVQGRNLVERVRWAKNIAENHLAQLGWKMTEGGFLKAVSVGFIPTRWVRNGTEDFAKAVKELGIDPEAALSIRYIYLEQEQIELSACIIGANPDALAKSYAAGCVKDADLAGVGFADDDMDFLQVAGRALDKPDTDEVTRHLIRREMNFILGRGKQSPKERRQPTTSDSPGTPGGGEIAERQAEKRKAFLKSLRGE